MNPYRTLTLWRTKERLRRELVSWQRAALGLFSLSAAVNLALMGCIGYLEKQQENDAAAYQQQLRQVEHVRDLAVRELGALSNQAARERQERADQAAAYEAIGVYRYIGACEITYYCPCPECCGRWADGLTATGLPVTPGVVAVDKSVIPLGSTVVIDGQKYLAADTGVTGYRIDVAVSDHAAALEKGVRTAEVWVERCT